MDRKTLEVYSKDAKDYLKRYAELEPYRMQELMDAFFIKKAKTVDIGCASGRDLKILNQKGYDVTGVDVVPEFVAHCQSELQKLSIIEDSLPRLSKLRDREFSNVLLCAVLMHLAGTDLIEAVSNIVRITAPKGRILLSFRPGLADKEREDDGRLFTPIAPSKLINLFEGFGTKLLFQEETEEQTRDGLKTWYNFVFEKDAK
jgi:SAM-dependent methyltransferase